MRVFVLLGFTVLLGCGKPTPNIEKVEPDEQKAQGVWKVISIEFPPGVLPPEQAPLDDGRVMIVGNLLTVSSRSGTRPTQSFGFQLDVSASPKTVDFVVCDEKGKPLPNRRGPGQPEAEMVFGIYKFEGDEWVLAVAGTGATRSQRPSDFRCVATAEPNLGPRPPLVIRLKKGDPNEPLVRHPDPWPKTPGTRKSATPK